jgi:hypothetical protein
MVKTVATVETIKTVQQAVRLGVVLAGWLFAAACGADRDDNTARVIIDMRCGSNADCPTGFACAAEAEHGPPTTMCQSGDPTVGCPHGYQTQVGYGQTFCKPPGSVGARSGRGSTSMTARGQTAGRAGGRARGGNGL